MDIDIYLRPLIDDLKDLWTLKGVETIDVATSKTFNMRAMLLLTINDFPARSSLSGWSGQGSWHALHVMKTLHLLQQYLHTDVAKPIIKLCSFFKQICSRTLMEDDMVKLESQLVDILCHLEQIYQPAFFDIMIHSVIHLPQEALKVRPIPYRWIEFPNQDMKEEFSGWFETQRRSYVNPLTGDDPDIIHVDNSSYLALTTSLNDLEIAALHIDGQSIDVDAPPDIIDVDEDDDIIDDKDVLPYDLADSDDEDLVNVDDGDGVAMSADVARGYGGDGGGDDRPPPHQLAGGCRGSGKNFWKAGKMHTRKETRNLGLRKIMDELGPQPIRFEWKDNGMMLPLGDHSSHWANLLGEIVREFPMHFGSWSSIPAERKARVLGRIRTQFDLKPHMQSELWPEIRKGIDQHLGKIYTDNKSGFGLIPRTWPGCASKKKCSKPGQDHGKCRQGSRSLAALRDKQMQSFATQEYPSLIQTFFDTHTVGGVFLQDEDRRLYEKMLRLQGLGTYIDDQIMDIVRGGSRRGEGGGCRGVGTFSVLVGFWREGGKDVLDVHVTSMLITLPDVNSSQKKHKSSRKQIGMITKAMSSDDRMSQMFTQLQSYMRRELSFIFSKFQAAGVARAGMRLGDDEDADEDEEDADS
ncbi:F-box domain containing protein [Tanacetum coccineum]